MKRKSIVLSDTEGDSAKKAVLTLEEKSGGLAGTLRLYNFSQEPRGVLSLGLYCGKKVLKAGLTFKSQMFYDFFVDLQEIPQKFSCAIVNFQNAEPKALLFGSSDGSADDVYANIISEVSGTQSYQKTKDVLDSYGVDFEESEKAEIEKEIDDELCHQNCENCIYKKYFYENSENGQEKTEQTKSETDFFAPSILSKTDDFKTEIFGAKQPDFLKENDKNGEKSGFFDKLKPQIDKLFETNPTENSLQNIFPSSKWVRVEFEDEGDFFVFGLLYDEDANVKYVCYGVPSVFDEAPPQELDGYPIWLPLDDEKGFGYWMTYQDAVTGEPLKAILD